MSKFKNLLFGNRLVRPLADYYHNLLDDYRLQERVTEIKADELDLSFPNEAITMIVVGQKASNQTYWQEGFGDQI